MLIILFPYPVHYYPWCASHCEINGDVSPQQGVAPRRPSNAQHLYLLRAKTAAVVSSKNTMDNNWLDKAVDMTTPAMKMTWKLTFKVFPTPTK